MMTACSTQTTYDAAMMAAYSAQKPYDGGQTTYDMTQTTSYIVQTISDRSQKASYRI